MKKAYIKPISECYEVNVQSIIALSLNNEQIERGHENEFEVLGREDNSVSNVWDSEW